jgi:Flp pilus assembly protein TadB
MKNNINNIKMYTFILSIILLYYIILYYIILYYIILYYIILYYIILYYIILLYYYEFKKKRKEKLQSFLLIIKTMLEYNILN